MQFTVGAEELHAKGAAGVRGFRDWLNATGRASMERTVYDLNPRTGDPYTQVRVGLLDGSFERFDLYGQLLEEDGGLGADLYVESKFYSSAGNQGVLYREYLAVCYSAFAARSASVGGPASMEFMWATTHPFSQGDWTDLTSEAQIAAACNDSTLSARLGGQSYDSNVGAELSRRLWLAVVGRRYEELIMGLELKKALQSRLIELRAA
jgi:hypothetical protein